jgi:hypothetical protein
VNPWRSENRQRLAAPVDRAVSTQKSPAVDRRIGHSDRDIRWIQSQAELNA